MKKLLFFVAYCMVCTTIVLVSSREVGAQSSSNLQVPHGYRIARNWGAKTSATLTNLLADLGSTEHWVVVLDGGAWTISTNVTFGTNIHLVIMDDTYFNIATSQTVTVNGRWTKGPTMAFTGDGEAAGDADFLYRWTEWGDETQYDIGVGVLFGGGSHNWGAGTNIFDWLYVTNLVQRGAANGGGYDYLGMGNIRPNGDGAQSNGTDTRRWAGVYTVDLDVEDDALIGDDLTVLGDLNLGGDLTVTGDTSLLGDLDVDGDVDLGGATFTDYISGYMKDCYGSFVDDDTVQIGTGEGICNGSWFEVTSASNVDVSLVGTGTNWHYFYIDDDQSSYPVPKIIASTTEPSESSTKHGWYNGNDRCIWAAIEVGNTIYTNTQANGEVMFTAQEALAGNVNPDGSWQECDDASPTNWLPVNVLYIVVGMEAQDSGAQCRAEVATLEHVNQGADAVQNNYFTIKGYDIVNVTGLRVYLGASRDLRVCGDNDDDNALDLSIQGYKIKR